jgi:hypothetical protein
MKKAWILFMALSYTGASIAKEDHDWYIGAGVGKANFEDSYFSESDNLLSLSGGYIFSKFFAVEAGYVDLGSVKGSVLPDNFITLNQDTLSLDASGFVVASKFKWELSTSLELAAKAGVSVIDSDKRWSGGTLVDGSIANDTGGTAAELFLGVQIQYQVSERFSVQLNWDRYKIEEIDVDGVYAKVNFHF